MSVSVDITARVYPQGHEGDPNYEAVCMWWARCRFPANTVKAHPILGDVPICKRCAEKIARLETA